MKYSGIDKAIKEGNTLHIFLSGGGLRVARIEKRKLDGELLGYAEHPNLMPTLEMVAEDYENGGKMANHYEATYLTGNSNPDSNLDSQILSGHVIDIVPSKDVLSEIKSGKLGYINVPAVQLTVSTGRGGTELLKIVGANVDEVIERAENEVKYLTDLITVY